MASYNDDMRCSFCGKSRSQVRKLIQGPNGVYICDECVKACGDIIRDSEGEPEDDFGPVEDAPI